MPPSDSDLVNPGASSKSFRTDQKVRFAEIHLEELLDYPNWGSNDEWENAHQESFFFHLTGALDGLLLEVNEEYELEVAPRWVKAKSLGLALGKSKTTSPALERVTDLLDDESGWLALLLRWRNHGAHQQHVGKYVSLSTTTRADNQFKDPATGEEGVGA